MKIKRMKSTLLWPQWSILFSKIEVYASHAILHSSALIVFNGSHVNNVHRGEG